MKRKLLCIFLALTMILALLPVTALAEPDQEPTGDPLIFVVASATGNDIILGGENGYTAPLVFSVEAANSTEENPGFGQEITLVKIENTSTKQVFDLADIHLSAEDTSYLVPAALTNAVKFREIDAGKQVVFTLTWKDAEDKQHTTDTVLSLMAATPSVEIRVTPDQLSVVPGTVVSIVYEVVNTGNVPLQYLTIADSEICSLINRPYVYTATLSTDVLNPGETKAETVMVELDASIHLQPEVSFAYNSKAYSQAGPAADIAVTEVLPTLTLSCDNYSVAEQGALHTFKYTINNTSPVQLFNIYVFDSDGADAVMVAGPLTLDPGQSYSGTYELAVNTKGFYKFKVLYSYDGASQPQELFAKTDKELKLPNDVSLTIQSITPDTITAPGEVTFALQLENGTLSNLKNIVITEENGLMVPRNLNIIIPAAAGGISSKYPLTVTVDVPATGTNVNFILSYSIDGETATTQAAYTVNFSPVNPTAAPEATATPSLATEEPTDPVEEERSSLLIWILVGVLILIVIAILIILLLPQKNDPEPITHVRRKMVNEALFDAAEEDAPEEADVPAEDDTDTEGVKIYKGKN